MMTEDDDNNGVGRERFLSSPLGEKTREDEADDEVSHGSGDRSGERRRPSRGPSRGSCGGRSTLSGRPQRLVTFRVTSTLTASGGKTGRENDRVNEVRMNVSMESVQCVVLLPFVEEILSYVAKGGLMKHMTKHKRREEGGREGPLTQPIGSQSDMKHSFDHG